MRWKCVSRRRFLLSRVVQVAVEEAVAPDQLDEHVEEEPGVLDVLAAVGGLQDLVRRAFVVVEERVGELFFGGVVVVEVAGVMLILARDERGADVGLGERL
jgi:hypothetical protein